MASNVLREGERGIMVSLITDTQANGRVTGQRVTLPGNSHLIDIFPGRLTMGSGTRDFDFRLTLSGPTSGVEIDQAGRVVFPLGHENDFSSRLQVRPRGTIWTLRKQDTGADIPTEEHQTRLNVGLVIDKRDGGEVTGQRFTSSGNLIAVDLFSDRLRVGVHSNDFDVQLNGLTGGLEVGQEEAVFPVSHESGFLSQLKIAPNGKIVWVYGQQSFVESFRTSEHQEVSASQKKKVWQFLSNERKALFEEVSSLEDLESFTFDDTLVYFRVNAELSQQALADSVGIDRVLLAKIERDIVKSIPRVLIEDIMDVFGWPQEDPRRDLLTEKARKRERASANLEE